MVANAAVMDRMCGLEHRDTLSAQVTLDIFSRRSNPVGTASAGCKRRRRAIKQKVGRGSNAPKRRLENAVVQTIVGCRRDEPRGLRCAHRAVMPMAIGCQHAVGLWSDRCERVDASLPRLTRGHPFGIFDKFLAE